MKMMGNRWAGLTWRYDGHNPLDDKHEDQGYSLQVKKRKDKKQCRKMETAIVENNNNRRTEQTGNQQKERKADRKQTETITQQHTTGNSKERQ